MIASIKTPLGILEEAAKNLTVVCLNGPLIGSSAVTEAGYSVPFLVTIYDQTFEGFSFLSSSNGLPWKFRRNVFDILTFHAFITDHLRKI